MVLSARQLELRSFCDLGASAMGGPGRVASPRKSSPVILPRPGGNREHCMRASRVIAGKSEGRGLK